MTSHHDDADAPDPSGTATAGDAPDPSGTATAGDAPDDGSEQTAGTVPAIRTEDLELTYGDGTQAVDGVSLSIPRGEFFGFLGPNGAGKTTAIKVLATLLSPTAGHVSVNGYDVTVRPTAVRATVGYMAQETSVDEELTARENLSFACEAYGVSGAKRERRIADLLDLVDLADVADRPAGTFSGGMRKRLDAATALVHDPDLVFLDEPTTGLDPVARNRLWDYFRRINDAGTTVFLTTQYLEEADRLCDRLAVIRDGEIVQRGTPAALKRRVGGQRLSVDVDGGRAAAASAAAVARDGDVFEPAATVAVGGGDEARGGGEAPADPAAGATGPHTVTVRTRHARERGTDFLLALRDAGVAVSGFDVSEPTLDDVFLAIADGEDLHEADTGDGAADTDRDVALETEVSR